MRQYSRVGPSSELKLDHGPKLLNIFHVIHDEAVNIQASDQAPVAQGYSNVFGRDGCSALLDLSHEPAEGFFKLCLGLG